MREGNSRTSAKSPSFVVLSQEESFHTLHCLPNLHSHILGIRSEPPHGFRLEGPQELGGAQGVQVRCRQCAPGTWGTPPPPRISWTPRLVSSEACPTPAREAGAAEPAWSRGVPRKRKGCGDAAQAPGRSECRAEKSDSGGSPRPTRGFSNPVPAARPASRGGRGLAPRADARPPSLQEGGARLRGRATRRSRMLPPPRRCLHGCPAGDWGLGPLPNLRKHSASPAPATSPDTEQGADRSQRGRTCEGARSPGSTGGGGGGAGTGAGLWGRGRRRRGGRGGTRGGTDGTGEAERAPPGVQGTSWWWRSRRGAGHCPARGTLVVWPCGGWALLGSPMTSGRESWPWLAEAGILVERS